MTKAAEIIGQSPSRASYVLARMRIDILAARLKPGQKLGFDLLTSTYKVGLSPLREALCQLVGFGLVTLESQRGFRVAPVSRDDLSDVIATRRWIESRALELSVTRGDDAWREEVRKALNNFNRVAARVGDQRPINEDWQEIHRRLHFALIGACDSPTLMQFCAQIYDRFDRYRRITIPAQAFMAGTAGDHGDIAQAALAGDHGKAKFYLERHFDDIAKVVMSKFDQIAADYETITPLKS